MYLSGQGRTEIAKELNRLGVKRENRKLTWHTETVRYILTNISYTGDQIWHKTYATDVLPFKQVKNKGQKPKYYAEECCPAIISKDEFFAVQKLMATRKDMVTQYDTVGSLYSKRIYCAECGASCHKKICNGKLYWTCRVHNHESCECPVKPISDMVLTSVLQRFRHKIWLGRDLILKPMLNQLYELREREMHSDRRVSEIDKEISKLAEQNLVLERLKSKGYVDPALYLSEQDTINGKVKELRRLRRKHMEKSQEDETLRKTEAMLDYLGDSSEWSDTIDSEMFDVLIDRIFLTLSENVRIKLQNGLEVIEKVVS